MAKVQKKSEKQEPEAGTVSVSALAQQIVSAEAGTTAVEQKGDGVVPLTPSPFDFEAVVAHTHTALKPLPVITNTPHLLIQGDKAFASEDNPILVKYKEVEVIKGAATKPDVPLLIWKGNKFPYDLWLQVLAFFKWTYDVYTSEGMVSFYYHKDTGEWRVWAPPQKSAGMSVEWDYGDEFNTQRALVGGRGWTEMGSAHHHCSSSAFQSGVDEKDETNKDGVHITIGNMNNKDTYTQHTRAYFSGQEYQTELANFVDIPENLNMVPAKHRVAILRDMVATPPPEGTTFPEAWKRNFQKKTYVTTTYNNPATGYFHGGGGYHHGDKRVGSTTIHGSHTRVVHMGKVHKPGTVIALGDVAQTLTPHFQRVKDLVAKSNLNNLFTSVPSWSVALIGCKVGSSLAGLCRRAASVASPITPKSYFQLSPMTFIEMKVYLEDVCGMDEAGVNAVFEEVEELRKPGAVLSTSIHEELKAFLLNHGVVDDKTGKVLGVLHDYRTVISSSAA